MGNRGIKYGAALAAATLLAALPGAAAAQSPAANDPAAEALHGQVLTALRAQPQVGVKQAMGDDETPDSISLDGTLDVGLKRFSGTLRMMFLEAKYFETERRTLVRERGGRCWELVKREAAPSFSSGRVFVSPADLIDKHTVGPAVFSVAAANEIRWTLAGRVPASVTERYDPATMLPISQQIELRFPKAGGGTGEMLRVSTEFRFTGLRPWAPKSPRICKKAKARKKR